MRPTVGHGQEREGGRGRGGGRGRAGWREEEDGFKRELSALVIAVAAAAAAAATAGAFLGLYLQNAPSQVFQVLA